MSKFLNFAVVGLLAGIGLLVYFIPSFNYEVLVRRQGQIESGFHTLLEKVEKLENVVDVGGEKRSGALKALDELPKRLEDLQKQLTVLSEHISLTMVDVGTIDSRLQSLERKLAHEAVGASTEASRHRPMGDYTSPVVLPDELARKARKLGPDTIAKLDTGKFIDRLMESGIIESTDGEIPPSLVERVHHLFEIFKTNIGLIQASQGLYVDEQVEQMTRQGRFMEAPVEGALRERMAGDQVGIRFVKIFHETGTKRLFELPIEDHPQINAFNEMRDNARDHLVLDASRLAESMKTPR